MRELTASGKPLRGRAQLEELRERLGKGRTTDIKLLIACDAGFDRDLVRLAGKRSDIELIDANRLLTGT